MAVVNQLPGSNGVNIATAIQTGEFVDQIDPEMKMLAGEVAPLVDYFGYGPSVKLNEEWKYRWMRNEAMAVEVTLLVAMDNSQTTLVIGTDISVNDANLLQVGAIVVLVPAYGSGETEEQVRVTANTGVSGTNITITRAFAGSASAHAVTTSCFILLASYTDVDTFPESPRNFGEFEYNYAMQTMYSWSQTDYSTSRVSYLQGKTSRQAKDVTAGREWALKQLNNAILYGVRRAPYNSGTQAAYFSGLRNLISTNVITATGGLITATDLLEALDLVKKKTGNSGQTFTLLMDTDMMRVVNGLVRTYYGPTVLNQGETTANLRWIKRIETDLGILEMMEVPQLRGEIIGLSDKNDFKLLPVEVVGMGTGWVEMHRGAENFNARREADALSWIGTAELGHEKRHFKITGIDPTLANYASAI